MDKNSASGPEPEKNEEPEPEIDQVSANKAAAEYAKTITPAKKSRRKPIIFITLVLLLLIVAGIFLLKRPKPESIPTTDLAPSSTQTNTTTTNISTETKKYDSSQFQLTFSYPSDWTVTDKALSGVLTAVSPPLSLTDSTGEIVTGQVIFMLRDHNQKLAEFDAGNATAAIASEKISYTSPGPTQRDKTYLSYLRYAGSEAATLDGLYITGDFGYKLDQAIPKVDISKIDPITSITFVQCSDSACAEPTMPLSISLDSWKNSSLSGPLKNILKSLSIN